MRGKKPAAPVDNVVAGVFALASVSEPDWLTEYPGESWGERAAEIASEKWNAAVADMTRMRTLGPENATALEMLAVSYARWRLAEAHITKHGPVVPAPRTGTPMQNPYLSIANGAAERCMKIEAELGLPPSMRGRVSKAAAVKKVTNAADRFLAAKA